MYLSRRPVIFDRGIYTIICVIGAVDVMMALGHVGARECVQAVTGWPSWLAGVPVVITAVGVSSLWWGALFVIERSINGSERKIVGSLWEGFAVVSAIVAVAYVLAKAGVPARMEAMTGWPPLLVSCLAAAGGALGMLLLWCILFTATASGRRDALVTLEYLIMVSTALTFVLLLHDVLGHPWWSSALLGVGGSLVVWVPLMHVRPGVGDRPSVSQDA